MAGATISTDLPTTAGAYQNASAGGWDDLVFTLDPAGGGAADLVSSTYLGGGSTDQAFGVAVDSSGDVYVSGFT